VIPAWLPVLTAMLYAAPADTAVRPPAPDSTTVTDRFARYESLLADYLVVTSAAGQPLETRFDYIKLHDNVGRFGRMSRIRNDLLAVPLSKMSRPERLAWAINTYNFLVLELTTENLLDRNISAYLRVQGYSGVARNSVQQIQIDGAPFFEAPVIEIEGKSYNLNTFERQFVFDGFDPKSGGKLPRALDPRAHFALVCAAKGCPPLRPSAYRAESLEVQLDRATREALASPSHLRWSADTGILYASSIFNWYAADFGGTDGAYGFLLAHAPPAVAEALRARPNGRIDQFIVWDWKLNSVPRAEQK
jgi:Protein of unknown function, DUF547